MIDVEASSLKPTGKRPTPPLIKHPLGITPFADIRRLVRVRTPPRGSDRVRRCAWEWEFPWEWDSHGIPTAMGIVFE